MDHIQANLEHSWQHCAHVDHWGVLENIEQLLHLVVSNEESGHEENTGEYVPEEEKRVDKHKHETFALFVLHHAPSMIHWESSPLADKLSAGECHIETPTNEHCDSAKNANDMVNDEISPFCHRVAQLEHADP